MNLFIVLLMVVAFAGLVYMLKKRKAEKEERELAEESDFVKKRR